MLDPDPDQMNANPQPWFFCFGRLEKQNNLQDFSSLEFLSAKK
jgi:hypothetical protein